MSTVHIPTKQRLLVKNREQGRCAMCQLRGAEWHHRRSRRVRDEHRHCACNGLWLCGTCHRWAHAEPVRSLPWGFVVSQYEATPFLVPYLRLGTEWLQATCGGLLQPLSADQVLVGTGGPPRLVRPLEADFGTGF
jgi:hypothetical protein